MIHSCDSKFKLQQDIWWNSFLTSSSPLCKHLVTILEYCSGNILYVYKQLARFLYSKLIFKSIILILFLGGQWQKNKTKLKKKESFYEFIGFFSASPLILATAVAASSAWVPASLPWVHLNSASPQGCVKRISCFLSGLTFISAGRKS